jgi:hypothetical protein
LHQTIRPRKSGRLRERELRACSRSVPLTREFSNAG